MEKKKELISIIVPCYNIEKYVERCICSITSQTYRNIEIIAIDDGSKDETGKILDKMGNIEPRMKVLHYYNEGLSCARNHGLECMKGEYVMCVDGDDFLNKRAIEILYTILIDNNLDIAASNYMLYYSENKQELGNRIDKSDYNGKPEDFIEKLFVPSKRFCSAWAKLYKRELFDQVRYPENIYFGEDMDVAPILFNKANKVGYTEEPLYFYNQQGVSLVRSKFNHNKLHMIDVSKEWIRLCSEKYPRLIQLAKNNYYSRMINICTLLAENEEFYGYYNKYRQEIKETIKAILESDIGWKDKAKARFIIYFKPQYYKNIHRLFTR